MSAFGDSVSWNRPYPGYSIAIIFSYRRLKQKWSYMIHGRNFPQEVLAVSEVLRVAMKKYNYFVMLSLQFLLILVVTSLLEDHAARMLEWNQWVIKTNQLLPQIPDIEASDIFWTLGQVEELTWVTMWGVGTFLRRWEKKWVEIHLIYFLQTL